MATKLEKNVRKIIDHHGGMVVNRGVTGGNWSNCDGLVEGRLICGKYERNNLAMWIKHHPDAELVESTFGAFYQLKGYCIATGAGTGDARTAVRSRYGMRSSRLMMRTSSPIMWVGISAVNPGNISSTTR